MWLSFSSYGPNISSLVSVVIHTHFYPFHAELLPSIKSLRSILSVSIASVPALSIFLFLDMAEVIALGASIIAFLQLTDRVIGLTKYYIEALNDCPGDIRTILVEISSLKAILESLDFLLRNNSGPEPHLMQQLAGDHGPIEECRKSVAELERLLPTHIRSVHGKRQKVLAAAEHIAWPLRENSVKKLVDNISRYKASIAFALTYDST